MISEVQAAGLRIAYLEAGPSDGPLALLLHGFPDTAHGWADLMPGLAEAGFRVVTPFARGYAPSGAPDGPVHLDALADDAFAVAEALGRSHVDLLVGHDWGGATAYLMASRAPERVKRLVAVGISHPATLKWTPARLWAGRHFIGLNLPGAVDRLRRRNFALVDTYYRRWAPTWAFGSEATAAVKAALSERAATQTAVAYYHSVRRGGDLNGFKGRRIQAPTLAVAGAHDTGFQPADFEAARRRFEGPYRVAVLPAGHFVHRECPERFGELVLAFVSASA